MERQITWNGLSYRLDIGEDAETEPRNFLKGAHCIETGEDVGEGHLFDALEREIWKQVKEGRLL